MATIQTTQRRALTKDEMLAADEPILRAVWIVGASILTVFVAFITAIYFLGTSF